MNLSEAIKSLADATELQEAVMLRPPVKRITLEEAIEDRCRLQLCMIEVQKENAEIEQICGKALGYPWYKDDQENFPGATETSGVCTGEHVTITIVMELARAYTELKARMEGLEK